MSLNEFGFMYLPLSTRFLSNTGAAAGVFTVVGILVGALALAMVLFCRRRRRASKRNKWIRNLKVPPEDPFADSNVSPRIPIMTTISVDRSNRSSGWSVVSPRGSTLLEEKSVPMDPQNVAYENTGNTTIAHQASLGTFGGHQQPQANHSDTIPGSGRSTPSVYPSTIADSFYCDDSSDEKVPEDGARISPLSLDNPNIPVPPPRPARSTLRDSRPVPDHVYYTSPPSSKHVPNLSSDAKRTSITMTPTLDGVDEDREAGSTITQTSIEDIGRRPTLLGVSHCSFSRLKAY